MSDKLMRRNKLHPMLNQLFQRSLLAIALLCCSFSLRAQENHSDSVLKDAPMVFIDCNFCDIDYIRQQVPYVNYVRDRKAAEVHVLVTRQNTGSGGKEWVFSFFGQERFAGMSDTLTTTTDVQATNDEKREARLLMIKLGLMRYIAKTPLARQVSVGFQQEVEPTAVEDPWRNWVFSVNANAWFNGESSYSNFNSWSSFSADKVTPELKIEIGASMNYRENSYDIGDATITTIFRSHNGYGRVVKSISDHWSYGATASANSSIFNNQKIRTGIYPGIEYNLYPYSESTRRQFRMLLNGGPVYNRYHEQTIFYQTEELLWNGELALAYQVQEKWGSVSASLNGSAYLNDFEKHRLSFNTNFNLRLVKGLSLRLSSYVGLIRDQINLPLAGATTEDILLQQRQLATDYEYWGSAGITYTFGSIYNSVVNPRFGQF